MEGIYFPLLFPDMHSSITSGGLVLFQGKKYGLCSVFGLVLVFLPPSSLIELLKDVKWLSSVREQGIPALDRLGFCGKLRTKDLFGAMDFHM